MALRKRRSGTGTSAALVVGGALALGGIAYILLRGKPGPGGGGGGTFPVTIRVRDTTGNPLPGATVFIGFFGPASTDAGGNASFAAIPGGTYNLAVTDLGYNSASQSITIQQGSTTFLTIMTQVVGCTPQPCPCGSAWSTITCSCVKQQPFAIKAPPTLVFNQGWVALGSTLGLIKTCAYYAPGITSSSCPGSPPFPCPGPGDTIQVYLWVQVVDSNGNPVCGQNVSASLSGTQAQWRFSDGSGSGEFDMTMPQTTTTTNANGYALFVIGIQIANVTLNSCLNPWPFYCTASQNFNVLFNVSLNLPGTLVPNAITQVNMQSLICAFAQLQ